MVRRPPYFKGITPGGGVVDDHDLTAIRILERHFFRRALVWETRSGEGGSDMVSSRDHKFAQMTQVVIVVCVGKLPCCLIDGYQTCTTPTSLSYFRAAGDIQRDVPEDDGFGPVLR